MRLFPGGPWRLGQPRGHTLPVAPGRVLAAELTAPGRQQLVVCNPLQTSAAMGVPGIARPGPRCRMLHHAGYGIDVR